MPKGRKRKEAPAAVEGGSGSTSEEPQAPPPVKKIKTTEATDGGTVSKGKGKADGGKENKTNWDGNELGQTKDWRMDQEIQLMECEWNQNVDKEWWSGVQCTGRDPDIFCVQETKCIEKELPMFGVPGYHVYWHPAEKKGYSGLKNPKTNTKTAGFTPEERQDFTELLEEGFVDTFRHLYPDLAGAYTYWSYRLNARAKNTG